MNGKHGINNSLLPLDKSIHNCMIVKDGKCQVTCRNKQTNKYFLHYKQLNTFDHPYHIHKYLDSEPSTFLLASIKRRYTGTRVCGYDQ